MDWPCSAHAPHEPGLPSPLHTLTWAGLSDITSGTGELPSVTPHLLVCSPATPGSQGSSLPLPREMKAGPEGHSGSFLLLPPLLFFLLLLPAFALPLSAPLQAWVPSNQVGG